MSARAPAQLYSRIARAGLAAATELSSSGCGRRGLLRGDAFEVDFHLAEKPALPVGIVVGEVLDPRLLVLPGRVKGDVIGEAGGLGDGAQHALALFRGVAVDHREDV